MSSCLLGAIADDLTGATDLCNTLVREGMRTVQTTGIPPAGFSVPDTDAIVVALKSRTIPAAAAIDQSLAALAWLQSGGARRIFFKYCSTFDSTDAGNIGPVADALLDRLGGDLAIACPAFPETGRSVFQGHLFVGDMLLSDSPMRDHPLTPMRDPSLVRVLQRQTRHKVGMAAYADVEPGAAALAARLEALRKSGTRHVIVDAVSDAHLRSIGEACADLALVTGGSGVARGLPAAYRKRGLLAAHADAAALPRSQGLAAVLAGSCSAATLRQIASFAAGHPALQLKPTALAAGDAAVEEAIAWARARIAQGPVLVYASAAPDEVAAAQRSLGRERAAELVERALARVATALVDSGVGKLVVAGGETSGAVVNALDVKALRIGPQIDPGVPWTTSVGGRPLALALKSGNFGAEDFFAKALRQAP
ncbi:MAG: four-carbon acid sugar kinase family protein [Alphaproteobacteria bacterium]|nr:four-carbon acid sugar kinase family protein [Alphaproteobacteria bacterium]